jgi:uncharacterized membrane protein YedE/YeeE
MIEESWVYGLLGGLTIGVAASIYLLMNGRIMGASGILGGLVDGSGRTTWKEQATFLLGLIAVPGLVALMVGAPETHITTNAWVLIAAGLLVGFGTRIAKGCTSGHGVCGIARLSLRGMVATVFYLLAGGLSIVVFKHILGVI